tara:strand:- start:197 stop:454 length:258 start_codon:yes stop_codon:yes gene_type:complete
MKDDEKKKHSSEDLEYIYQETFGHAVDFMRDFDVQAVAATYMAIAMRLYKTHLDENEYKAMIRTVMETEVEVYPDPKKYLKKVLN